MSCDYAPAVENALRNVLDPCSCFTDEPVNIVDLGLVENVSFEEGSVRVDPLLTSPGCTYYPYIKRDVESRLLDLDGVDTVEVNEVTGEVWTRDRMDDDVRTTREQRMENRLERAGIEPYYD